MLKTILYIGASLFLCGLSTGAGSATLIPIVPVPGSCDGCTGVIGINNNNIIAGTYSTPDFVQHGYLGPLDGSDYVTFDYGGNATATEARAINDDGWVTGMGIDEDCSPFGLCEFVRQPDGTILNIEKDGAILQGTVQGITTGENLVGDYGTQDGKFGYQGQGGNYMQDFALPCCTADAVRPRGINASGAVAGYYFSNRTHGFVFQNGIAMKIDYPDTKAHFTFVEGLNDKGLVAGSWTNKRQRVTHAFKLNTATGTFTSLDVPGMHFVTQAWAPNNAGLIPLDSDAGVYIYCPRKKSKCPAAANAIEIPDAPSIRMPASYFHMQSCRRGCTERGAATRANAGRMLDTRRRKLRPSLRMRP